MRMSAKQLLSFVVLALTAVATQYLIGHMLLGLPLTFVAVLSAVSLAALVLGYLLAIRRGH